MVPEHVIIIFIIIVIIIHLNKLKVELSLGLEVMPSEIPILCPLARS